MAHFELLGGVDWITKSRSVGLRQAVGLVFTIGVGDLKQLSLFYALFGVSKEVYLLIAVTVGSDI